MIMGSDGIAEIWEVSTTGPKDEQSFNIMMKLLRIIMYQDIITPDDSVESCQE